MDARIADGEAHVLHQGRYVGRPSAIVGNGTLEVNPVPRTVLLGDFGIPKDHLTI